MKREKSRATGTVMASIPIKGLPTCAVVDNATSRVYIGTSATDGIQSVGHVYVFDAASLSVISALDIGTNLTAIAVNEVTGRIFVADSGPEEYGMPLSSGRVFMLDVPKHQILNVAEVGASPRLCTIHLHVDHVFVGAYGYDLASGNTCDETIYMLDASSGNLLKSIDAGFDPIALSIIDTPHMLYVANFAGRGTVTTINAQNGDVLNRSPIGNTPSAMKVHERLRKVLVTNAFDKSLTVLNMDGSVYKKMPVVWHPMHIVVDNPVNRVIILNGRATASGDLPYSEGVIFQVSNGGMTDSPVGEIKFASYIDAIELDEAAGVAYVLDVQQASVYLFDMDVIEERHIDEAPVLNTIRVGAIPYKIKLLKEEGIAVVVGKNGADGGVLTILNAGRE